MTGSQELELDKVGFEPGSNTVKWIQVPVPYASISPKWGGWQEEVAIPTFSLPR